MLPIITCSTQVKELLLMEQSPAPPGMYKTLVNHRIFGCLPYQLVSRISEPSTVVPTPSGLTVQPNLSKVYITLFPDLDRADVES